MDVVKQGRNKQSKVSAKNTTSITIKYDIGYNNQLFVRGKGADLGWDQGVKLTNVSSNEWVWETDSKFTTCEFKVLINDEHFEAGENHKVRCGASIQYTPSF